MNGGKKRVIFDGGPESRIEDAPFMEFRLTYAGPLYATQRDPIPGKPPKHTENRHHIRKTFHSQLKRLWSQRPGLGGPERGSSFMVGGRSPNERVIHDRDGLAKRHSHYGFNFVPLVTEELDLLCSLEILLLRPDRPGDVMWGGDIDNRIKTFLDAMRIPEAGENYVNRTPNDDEKPFFVLLEDDKLLTKVSVETDRLLEPIGGSYEASDARIVVTVRIRPYEFMPENMHFGS